MKIVEKTYYKMPNIIQNLLVSLYGVKLFRERYSGFSKKYNNLLQETETYNASQIQNLQEGRFIEIAHHALKTVPYYRQWAAKSNITCSDIRYLDDLKKFPILTKEVVRQNPKAFLSEAYAGKRNLIKLSTSGSTGTPLTVFSDPESRTFHYAFFSRLRGWFGLKSRCRRATLFGRMIMLADQDKPPFWRYDFAQNNLLMSSYHLSDKNIFQYYNKLLKYDPEEIISYPSSVYQIAKFITENNLKPLYPKVVITTAETLLNYQREVIETAIQAPLIDQYGCTEMAFFASQCEHGFMHFHPEHGIPETLDESGDIIIGKPGRLVVTGLVNKAMPLIRYEVGDQLTMSSDSSLCSCGRFFPVIERLEGRLDDILYRRDGTPIGRLDPVFKWSEGIIAAKIIQKDTGDLDIFVQPSPAFSEKHRVWLYGEIKKRLGNGIDLRIRLVDEIPKEKNGKFKAVESHYRAWG